MSDADLADSMYHKYYSDMNRVDFNEKVGLMKPLSEEEKPAVNVGGAAFTAAARAGEAFVDRAAGIVQHGAEILKGVGIPVDQEAANKLANDIRSGYAEFKGKSLQAYRTTEEEHPTAGAVGDVSGELLIYAATGPLFTETVFGKALLKAGPIVGRVLQGALQGAALEGAKSTGQGSRTFWDAAEGAFGAGIGAGIGGTLGAGVVRAANAKVLGNLRNQLETLSKGWTADNQSLAKAFTSKIQSVDQKLQKLNALKEQALQKAGIILKKGDEIPANAPDYVKAVSDAVDKYEKDTEFLRSRFFTKLENASEKEGGDVTFTSANKSLIGAIMGNDKELSDRAFKAFAPNERELIQKGIAYEALQKATEGNTYNPEELRKVLKSPGVRAFFPGDSSKILDGFVNLADELKHTKPPGHGIALAHYGAQMGHAAMGTALGAQGAYYGYKQEGVEGAVLGGLAGYLGYIALAKSVNTVMGTQAGKNFLAAAADVKPGTPKAARMARHLFQMTGTTIGGSFYDTTLKAAAGATLPSSEGEAGPR